MKREFYSTAKLIRNARKIKHKEENFAITLEYQKEKESLQQNKKTKENQTQKARQQAKNSKKSKEKR